MVAAIVQTLCAAWTLEQALGRVGAAAPASPTQEEARGIGPGEIKLSERPVFYTGCAAACGGACAFSCLTDNAVDMSVLTEFCNGVLMPPVVFTLWYLAAHKLPAEHQLVGFQRWMTFAVFGMCSTFCVGSIFFSFGS